MKWLMSFFGLLAGFAVDAANVQRCAFSGDGKSVYFIFDDGRFVTTDLAFANKRSLSLRDSHSATFVAPGEGTIGGDNDIFIDTIYIKRLSSHSLLDHIKPSEFRFVRFTENPLEYIIYDLQLKAFRRVSIATPERVVLWTSPTTAKSDWVNIDPSMTWLSLSTLNGARFLNLGDGHLVVSQPDLRSIRQVWFGSQLRTVAFSGMSKIKNGESVTKVARLSDGTALAPSWSGDMIFVDPDTEVTVSRGFPTRVTVHSRELKTNLQGEPLRIIPLPGHLLMTENGQSQVSLLDLTTGAIRVISGIFPTKFRTTDLCVTTSRDQTRVAVAAANHAEIFFAETLTAARPKTFVLNF